MIKSRSSLEIQKSVIFALFVRELKTRFGQYRLGYFWAVLEPLLHIAVLLAIFGLRPKRLIPNMDFPVFLLTGLVPFFMFRNIVRQVMCAAEANKGLFNYRQVKPIDAMIARLMLEGIIFLFVYILLIFGAGWLGYDVRIRDPLGLIAIYALLYLFSFGIGVIACVVSTLYNESKKFIPIILRPLYFLSGIFFSISMIPQKYWHYFLWNPLLHFIELSRMSFFASFNTPAGSINYIAFCTLAALILGLSLYRIKRLEMVASS